MKYSILETIVSVSILSGLSFSAYAGKGRDGGDPRVNAFLDYAESVCDAKMLPNIDGAPSSDLCINIVESLTAATASKTGGVGFVSQSIFDDKGFEKVCVRVPDQGAR
jgi:hypothetical protein